MQEHQFAFFANYALAVLVINYVLLPNYFYQRRYWQFFIFFSILITAVIIIEEFVLEKIYFPDGRGRYFQGVYFSLLDVLPVITILSGFKFAWDIIMKQSQVEKLKATIEESELQLLKSQINPHFLFNNLNNLYSYALTNSEKTPKIILELSSVLRYMLYECQERYVPLEIELKQLENYIKLYELQIEERGEVKFSVPDLPGHPYKIAPLVLMVFVENAFKHSADSQVKDIAIDIAVELIENKTLKFRCSNTFQERTTTPGNTQGIGLENVKKRLNYIYPDSHTLQINASANVYRVTLTIDLT